MLFDELDDLIPAVPADKENLHIHTIYISGGYGWSVRVRYPGKHGSSSGDFVIEVLAEGKWDDYFQFKHSDFFEDVVLKWDEDPERLKAWLEHLLAVVQGEERPYRMFPTECDLPGIHLDALTNAFQALAVCEWRRFPQGDKRGGGRLLPINYLLAILQGYWDVDQASKLMRKGFPALRDLDGFRPFRIVDDPVTYLETHLSG